MPPRMVMLASGMVRPARIHCLCPAYIVMMIAFSNDSFRSACLTMVASSGVPRSWASKRRERNARDQQSAGETRADAAISVQY